MQSGRKSAAVRYAFSMLIRPWGGSRWQRRLLSIASWWCLRRRALPGLLCVPCRTLLVITPSLRHRSRLSPHTPPAQCRGSKSRYPLIATSRSNALGPELHPPRAARDLLRDLVAYRSSPTATGPSRFSWLECPAGCARVPWNFAGSPLIIGLCGRLECCSRCWRFRVPA